MVDIARLTKVCAVRKYSADEIVFNQGDPGHAMYILLSGSANVLIQSADSSFVPVSNVKAGDFFGELSLFDESARSASAVARTPLKVIGFFRPDLLGLLNRSPKIGTKILLKLGEVIGARLRITNEELINLSAELEMNQENKRGGSHVDSKP